MERKNSIYRVLYYECPIVWELFPVCWDICPVRWDFSPRVCLPYVICACRAPLGAVGPSLFLLFACFGCKNTLNSSVFVMKRENLLVCLKKVL